MSKRARKGLTSSGPSSSAGSKGDVSKRHPRGVLAFSLAPDFTPITLKVNAASANGIAVDYLFSPDLGQLTQETRALPSASGAEMQEVGKTE